ncbi:toll/interleukin-1 receptor domain-containing protein [Clostridium estertheticum]|uniref:toll/interleukin-1 receptor domain-containing protein n=1 Tax=Clostridium estertheticum TaxID=238834 RepID=UPI001CF2A312|nr:toll/interleukin-1 receptor domain-containing protein [Clostridium estertheticum]MCB2358673.1 toll/interleukin-1 receptor domain-containing protein [Clostridium estertheticum]
MRKLKVFLSYSHKDEEMKTILDIHLSMLKRNDIIETWNDRCITVGSELEEEILSNLENADIILLLVSPYFLASNYCYDKEMNIALNRHENGNALVIPIILKACDWLNSPLKKLTVTPKDGKFIKGWTDEDEAYFQVKQDIENAIQNFSKKVNP